MISLCLSEDHFETLERALTRALRIELADAATFERKSTRKFHLERARRIKEVQVQLDYALPEPDHR
jgi:hypothetical protein